ncbi:MAG: hypothetical protein KKG91_06085 [Candidatus Omnitrophica bacterium]|nr:hypothetical protein [Candidatus Omnitrophota bacterium]
MCYVAPLIGAGISSGIWKMTKSIKVWWLSLMFYGGALFGVIDHWWNGELFLISENIVSDALLGVTISVIILAVWVVVLRVSKINPTLSNYIKITS